MSDEVTLYRSETDVKKKTVFFEKLVMSLIGKGAFKEILDFALEHQKFSTANNDIFGSAVSSYSFGMAYFFLNDDEKAIEHYLKSIDLHSKASANHKIPEIYNTIAGIYYRNKDFKICLEFMHKGLEALQDEENDTKIAIYNNMSRVYRETGELDKATKSLQTAIEINQQVKSKNYDIMIPLNLSELYADQDKVELALRTIESAIDKCKTDRSPHKYVLCCRAKSLFLHKLNRIDEAIDLSKSLIPICTEEDYEELELFLYNDLSKLFKLKRSYKNALFYMEKYNDLNSSIFKRKSKEKKEEFEAKFELLEKEKENIVYSMKNKELKSALDEAQKLKDELEEKYEENERLLRVLTHDLSNPLQAIMSMNELILTYSKNQDKKSLKYGYCINSMCQNMFEIIDFIKQMLAVESGKACLALKSVNLNHILSQSITVFEEKLRKKKIKLNLNFSAQDDFYILVEPVTFLNSVLNNILSNSIKFSYPDSSIDIGIRADDKEVNISFRDYGIGMREKNLSTIFNLTGKTSNKGTMGESGVGFGMPLVKKYMSVYNGNIIVDSRHVDDYPDSHGTTVTIALKKVVKAQI